MNQRLSLPGTLARLARHAGNARLQIFGAAVVLLLAACGQTPAIVLTLDDAGPKVLRGKEVHVEVTLTRTGGASADVALEVTGLPANVTASFAPATLSGATLMSTLTLAAEADAAEGSYPLSVTGTGAGVTDAAELTLQVNSLSVSGRVVGMLEVPLVGVYVGSQGDTAVTNVNGEFTLTGLSIPYDLSIWSLAEDWLQVYEGLSTTDAVFSPLAAFADIPTPVSGTIVSGNLSGGVIPVGADQMVYVCIESLDGTGLGCDTVDPTESAYSIDAQWFGGAALDVRVHALQFEFDGAIYPVAYHGYTSVELTLTDGVPTMLDLNLGAALDTTTVDLEIDSPIAVGGSVGAVQVGPNLTMHTFSFNGPATTHEVLMPVIDGATYTFVAFGNTGQIGWQAGVTGTASNVTLPESPELLAPARLAMDVTSATDFTVANPEGGPVTFIWTANVGNQTIGLTTMEETHTIPDLAPYGMALQAAADYNWIALGHSGSSADAATNALNEYIAITGIRVGSRGPQGEGTIAFSTDRDFTTAP